MSLGNNCSCMRRFSPFADCFSSNRPRRAITPDKDIKTTSNKKVDSNDLCYSWYI